MMYASAMGKDDYKQKINCNDAVLDLISNLGNNIGKKPKTFDFCTYQM